LILRFRAGGQFEIVGWILGWGDAAEVLASSKLRDHVGTILSSAVARYGGVIPATKAG
jgi:predicted DNA-binding transcriptional regulator YafY